MSEWQPISTAPKMKNIILFAFMHHMVGTRRNWRMGSGFWHTGMERWIWEGEQIHSSYVTQPTHWRPLPEPPPCQEEEPLDGGDTESPRGAEPA